MTEATAVVSRSDAMQGNIVARLCGMAECVLDWQCSPALLAARLYVSYLKARWQAGYEQAREQMERATWRSPVDSLRGVVVYDVSEIRT